MNDPELPAEWIADGWTPETAAKVDEKKSAGWGDVSADGTAANPSDVEGQS